MLTFVCSSSTPLAGFGSLDFDIIWEEALNLLKIKLFRARNLRSGDSNGLSDPYIKVHLVPGVAKVSSKESEVLHSPVFLPSRPPNFVATPFVER